MAGSDAGSVCSACGRTTAASDSPGRVVMSMFGPKYMCASCANKVAR